MQPAAGDDGGGSVRYTEVDVARLQLLCTLSDDMALDEEALPVILHLLDQLHGVRAALRGLIVAVEQQAPAVREDIARALRARRDG